MNAHLKCNLSRTGKRVVEALHQGMSSLRSDARCRRLLRLKSFARVSGKCHHPKLIIVVCRFFSYTLCRCGGGQSPDRGSRSSRKQCILSRISGAKDCLVRLLMDPIQDNKYFSTLNPVMKTAWYDFQATKHPLHTKRKLRKFSHLDRAEPKV